MAPPLAFAASPPHLGGMIQISALPARRVVEVTGEERVGFLQGLVSNDVTEAAPGRAVWAALLTPQGKYLADFFILSDGDRLLLDCAESQAALVVQKLSRLRLRAKVAIAEAPAWLVYAAWGAAPLPGATTAPDPRLEQAGWRILSATPLETNADAAMWNAHRLSLGLPDTQDMEPDRTVLLEANFDALHGISWTKGCYMGQELTARTKYRGLLKRRLMPVAFAVPLPPSGTPIMDGPREVGILHAGQGDRAMATLRLDALARMLTCAGQPVTVLWPDWMGPRPDASPPA